MNKFPILIAGLILGGFGIIGAALVGFTNEQTQDIIAENERQALLKQLQELVPAESFDNELLTDWIDIQAESNLGSGSTRVYRARKDGELVATILTPVDAAGYAGPIRLIVAINRDGTLAGVRVLRHRETPGLGDKIETRRSDWVLSFNGKSLENTPNDEWKVKRDGGIFDQFTGATITPRSIVVSVKKALDYYHENKAMLGETAATAPQEVAKL